MPLRDLVLGGEGLIGRALVQRLEESGNIVTSLDLKNGWDLRLVDEAPFHDCDRVWFLAWDTGGAKYIEAVDRQHEMYKHNCDLSSRVFDHLAHTKKPFVYTTSQLAGLPNAYGLTKLMAEHWTRQLGGKVAKLWNTYGWEQPDKKSHVVTDLVLSALSTGKISCMTNGREKRRFIYKSDCVEAIVGLFESDLDTVDIAGPVWLSIHEVASEIAAQLDVSVEFGNTTGYEILVEPVNLLPNWAPQVQFTEGIRRVIADARGFMASAVSERPISAVG
jgi:nucleoside-diphosphate-sugar epimerase